MLIWQEVRARVGKMINAHVEMDLNDHVSVVAAKLIGILKNADNEILFESLMKEFLKEHESYTPNQFMDASIFLYMLGCIDIDKFKVKVTHV